MNEVLHYFTENATEKNKNLNKNKQKKYWKGLHKIKAITQ